MSSGRQTENVKLKPRLIINYLEGVVRSGKLLGPAKSKPRKGIRTTRPINETMEYATNECAEFSIATREAFI